MKYIATVAAALAAALAASAAEVDGVVAAVGGATILRSDVVREMRRRGLQDESRFAEVRNSLIERQLVLRAAAASKLTMQDWIVDDRVRRIVDDAFGGDMNKLKEALAREKTTYAEWRRRVKEDLVVGAMRWNCVEKNVSPSPSALRDEYDAHPEKYGTGGRVTVSVILLPPDAAAKRAEVEEALKASDFAEVAKKHSSDPRAKEGGVWKDVRPQEAFSPAVCAEIEKTPVGTISKWVDIDGWSFLLRKDAETPPSVRPFEDAVEDVQAAVREAESKRLYDAWIERLKSETYIKVY